MGGELKENIRTLNKKFENNEKLTWLTCYDYSFAGAVDSKGIDMILVADCGNMAALGYADIVPITMEEMTIHASAIIGILRANK